MIYRGLLILNMKPRDNDSEDIYELEFELNLPIKLSRGDLLHFESLEELKIDKVVFYTEKDSLGIAFLRLVDVKFDDYMNVIFAKNLLEEFSSIQLDYFLNEVAND